MNHPILVAALAEDRRRQCSCGAVTQEPKGTCRGCRGSRGLATPDRTVERSHRFTLTPARVAKAQFFAWVASLLQIIGKGAES
jgi:hypothetical protein